MNRGIADASRSHFLAGADGNVSPGVVSRIRPANVDLVRKVEPLPDQAQRKMLPELKLLAQSQIERAERAGEADVRRNGVDWAAGLTRVRPWASGRAFHFSIRAFN